MLGEGLEAYDERYGRCYAVLVMHGDPNTVRTLDDHGLVPNLFEDRIEPSAPDVLKLQRVDEIVQHYRSLVPAPFYSDTPRMDHEDRDLRTLGLREAHLRAQRHGASG